MNAFIYGFNSLCSDATQRLATPYGNNSSNGGVVATMTNGAGSGAGALINAPMMTPAEKKDVAETHMSADVVDAADGDSPGACIADEMKAIGLNL